MEILPTTDVMIRNSSGSLQKKKKSLEMQQYGDHGDIGHLALVSPDVKLPSLDSGQW